LSAKSRFTAETAPFIRCCSREHSWARNHLRRSSLGGQGADVRGQGWSGLSHLLPHFSANASLRMKWEMWSLLAAVAWGGSQTQPVVRSNPRPISPLVGQCPHTVRMGKSFTACVSFTPLSSAVVWVREMSSIFRSTTECVSCNMYDHHFYI